MRLRVGLLAGFAAGAYVATKRSRQRTEMITQRGRRTLKQAAFDTATEKAMAVVDHGVERAKGVVTSRFRDPGLLRPLIQAPARMAAHQRNGGSTT